MNQYQKAMFKSYWFPVVLFFVFPNVVILAISMEFSDYDLVSTLFVFPILLFVAGYLTAPYFGPKVARQKGMAFLMSYICLFIALAGYLAVLMGPHISNLEFSFYMLIFLFVLSIFPALMGALFFIGNCNNVPTTKST